MPKKPTKRRRKPPANPSAFTINRALLPYMRAPVADWEKISRRLATTRSRAPIAALRSAEAFTLLAEYLRARAYGSSHDEAGREAYGALIGVRHALGITFYRSTPNPFRHA